MKLGSYEEFDMRDISIETMIRKVDMLEGVVDRMMSPDTVSDTISKYVNLKEIIEQDSDQSKNRIFTSSIIDSQMGASLGVTSTGIENHKLGVIDSELDNQKIEGSYTQPPEADDVEKENFSQKLSCVKKLFQELRLASLAAMETSRCTSPSGGGSYSDIWSNIDTLATPLYTDLDIMNELIEDAYNDYENPGRHCSVTHAPMLPGELKTRITSLKCIIQDAVVDVMIDQASLPTKGLNILDSMFNQLWEYGEKGPIIELPTWC